jgi:hypothetical protein
LDRRVLRWSNSGCSMFRCLKKNNSVLHQIENSGRFFPDRNSGLGARYHPFACFPRMGRQNQPDNKAYESKNWSTGWSSSSLCYLSCGSDIKYRRMFHDWWVRTEPLETGMVEDREVGLLFSPLFYSGARGTCMARLAIIPGLRHEHAN